MDYRKIENMTKKESTKHYMETFGLFLIANIKNA
jgi:hypothetical protein